MSETTGVYVYQQIAKTTAGWAADTNVWPKHIWLFEIRTDGKIVVKLSDGLHPFSKLPQKMIDAYEAALEGGYTGTREEFYASLGAIDTKVETVTNLVKSLEGKYAETPTLDGKPTENTLSYTSDGVTRDFSIGQQCRVYDGENEKYVFYQLYDITAEGKADWQIAGSDGSAFMETILISLSSNQGTSDTSLHGNTVTVQYGESSTELVWEGSELTFTVPMGVEYKVIPPSVPGYTSPTSQGYTAVGGNKRQLSLVYSCEKVTVNVTADDGADTSSRTVTVTSTSDSSVIGAGTGSEVTVKIPLGIGYKVSVDEWEGYISPSDHTYTANSTSRTITMEYEKIVDASIVFDKSVSDPENITGDINAGTIAMILAKFRRCLCKKTADGEVSIAYLRDDNSNYYEDGTAAKLDGTEGDVMVDFPEFFYKWEQVDSNKFRYRFALYNVDGTFKHVPRSLVGAYKGYVASSKLYSRSGVTPTASKSTTEFDTYATARGTGYQRIDFQQHCVIAFMLYARYGNRNLQAVLGAGGAMYDSNNTTGSTNSRGIQDTVKETANYVNGLGIEGVFGCLLEWVKGVSINNRVWTITDPDGSTREVNAGTTDGWITNVAAEAGPYFDMVPTAVGGSETTHYADYYWQSSSNSLVLARSNNSSLPNGGVAYANANFDASNSDTNYGSRLAFRGVIREAASVSAFKALSVL